MSNINVKNSKAVSLKKKKEETNSFSLENLKKDYDKRINKIIKEEGPLSQDKKTAIQSEEDYIKVSLMEAEKVWLYVRSLVATNPQKYMEMKDEEKIELIKREFAEFHNEFPIPCRYMSCMGQYNNKAFKKYLKKCKAMDTTSKKTREEGYMEDQWVQRQADYVRYLWEEYQGSRRFQRKESDAIWRQTYNALKQEFKDFKDMYKETEELVKVEDKIHKKELLYEMANRIINGSQSLDNNTAKELYEKLKDKLYKQRADKMLIQLKDTVKLIPAKTSAYGRNEYAQMEYEEEMKQAEYKKKYKFKKEI